jgi:hypothetical protein
MVLAVVVMLPFLVSGRVVVGGKRGAGSRGENAGSENESREHLRQCFPPYVHHWVHPLPPVGILCTAIRMPQRAEFALYEKVYFALDDFNPGLAARSATSAGR